MKLSLLAVAIATGAIAAPTQSNADLGACKSAPNCETWFNHHTNRTHIRFKKDMGPDSDWYHKNVRLLDPIHPLNLATGRLVRRDGTTYNADRSTVTQEFGNVSPVDVANSMYGNCEAASCEDKSWTFETFSEVASGGSVSKGQITVNSGGQWDSSDPANRGNFIEALKAQSGPSTQRDNVPIAIGGEGEVGYYSFFTGTNYIDTNRYVDGNLQGYASMSITYESSEADTCDIVTSILSAAVGAVSAIGGGFFGIAGALTCGVSS